MAEGNCSTGTIDLILQGSPRLIAAKFQRSNVKSLDFTRNAQLMHLFLSDSQVSLSNMKSLYNVTKLDLSNCHLDASLLTQLASSLPQGTLEISLSLYIHKRAKLNGLRLHLHLAMA